MPDTTPLPLPECPREDCTENVDHWHSIPDGESAPCQLTLGNHCSFHVDPEVGCYAPRTQHAPQPPAVVLPTVDEVEAVIKAGGFYSDTAQAVLDLIAERQPAPQPIDPADVRVGDRVEARWCAPDDDTDQVHRFIVAQVSGRTIMSTDARHYSGAAFYLIDRTDPDAPLVETIAQAIAAGAGDSLDDLYRGEARAVLDAIRAEWTIEPKAARS